MSAEVALIGGKQRNKRGSNPKSRANLKPPFKKGQSGNPSGLKKGFQRLSDAYKRLMCMEPEELEKYRAVDYTERIAKELLMQAVNDEERRIQAVKEIADRTEGKPEANKNVRQDVTVRVVFDDDPRSVGAIAPVTQLAIADSEPEQEV